MNQVAAGIEKARAKVSAAAVKFLPDLCSFTAPTGAINEDAWGETSTAEGASTSDVPCSYEALSAYERGVGGTMVSGATHRLKVPATGNTLGIKGNYKGTIAARGTTPALPFEVTGRLDSSSSVFLELAITIK